MRKIKVDMFGQEVLLFDSRKDIDKWLKKNPIESQEDFETSLDTCTGLSGAVLTEDDAHWVVYLAEKDLRTLTHECVHMAYFLLDVAGVEHDVTNHEVFAYLQDYLFGECAKALKIPVVFD